MSATKKKFSFLLFLSISCYLASICLSAPAAPQATHTPSSAPPKSATAQNLAQSLGWVEDSKHRCGGYYLEQAFVFPIPVSREDALAITGESGLLSQHGTSELEGGVSLTREGQQITANKAFVYRDPNTGKLDRIDIIGNVHLREPNTLIVSKHGQYFFANKAKSLRDIFYRTSLKGKQILGPQVDKEQTHTTRQINTLTAWGQAKQFSQTKPKVYEFSQTSYSTCSPLNPIWKIKASRIVLNKETGRGYATHAKLIVHNMPVFYAPYINFPIDDRRKTGFLWPTFGSSNAWGSYAIAPFYWNIAENYDMTITPSLLSKRGIQLSENFRYLSATSSGNINASILPRDRAFTNLQKKNILAPPAYQSPEVTEAELNRLHHSSTTRKAFFWRDTSRFNEHWSTKVDFNYAGDDYYLRDFGNNLNEITSNQLLQQAEVNYKNPYWDFTGRIQAYQTLHPFDESLVLNQYRRFPQLILNGSFPHQAYNLNYFMNSEFSHFDIRHTPGVSATQPIGNRTHLQPGISLDLSNAYAYLTPRLQFALTAYDLYQTAGTGIPSSKQRALPIFDVASGIAFNRDTSFMGNAFQQTLEPQIYYAYIPYRNQSSIPVFDTTINTLAYDQIFNYNRFSSLDRIGDTHQIGLGIATRWLDAYSGLEKIRIAVGELIYFKDRRVTLCNDNSCTDNPMNPNNRQRLSPLSATIDYHLNPRWRLSANPIWNPRTKQIDNVTTMINYSIDPSRVINLAYSFARASNPLSGLIQPNSSDNLKVTDVSFAWPLIHEIRAVGRWSQNWNQHRLQNLLYGIQYDSCCWAVRLVGGRAFTSLDPTNNNKPQYRTQFFIQFSLKGLGDMGTGDPSQLLQSVTGYQPQFAQDI